MSVEEPNKYISNFISELKKTVSTTRNSQYNMVAKVERAIQMFSNQKKILFVFKNEKYLTGVIQSSRNEEQEYITYIDSDGNYYCCNPLLEDCLGLGRKMCKHIMLSMIAAIKLNPIIQDELLQWTESAKKKGPHIINDIAESTYQRYKLALVGDVQWRPIELLPEDYVLI
jgi:hypothetical protein